MEVSRVTRVCGISATEYEGRNELHVSAVVPMKLPSMCVPVEADDYEPEAYIKVTLKYQW